MDIAEKRVYEDRDGRTRLAVGTGAGLAVVGLSGAVVGEFGLALRSAVRDVAAAGDGRVLVATDEDVHLVLLGPDDGGIADVERIDATGAGTADAVTLYDGHVVAAGRDGVVRRAPLGDGIGHDGPGDDTVGLDSVRDGSMETEHTLDWDRLGDATVRAADGPLLAASDGVYRVGADGIDHVGLDDARDVVAAGPLAATGEGCFRLGPGWTAELDGAFDVVAAARTQPEASRERSPSRSSGASRALDEDERPSAGDLAHAAAGSTLYAYEGNEAGRLSDGEWTEVAWPANAPVAGVDYGEATYAVATDGTVLADDGSGWRTRSIGLPDVVGCTVVR